MRMESFATDRTITRVVSGGVEKWMKNKNFEMPMRATGKMRNFIEDQNKIGWDQVVCGRISKEAIKIQGRHLIENKHITKVHKDANKWLRLVIQTLWENVEKMWKTRCEEKYGKSREDKKRRKTIALRKRM